MPGCEDEWWLQDKLHKEVDEMITKKKQAIEIFEVSNNIANVSHCNFTNCKIEFSIPDANAIAAFLKSFQNNNSLILRRLKFQIHVDFFYIFCFQTQRETNNKSLHIVTNFCIPFKFL